MPQYINPVYHYNRWQGDVHVTPGYPHYYGREHSYIPPNYYNPNPCLGMPDATYRSRPRQYTDDQHMVAQHPLSRPRYSNERPPPTYNPRPAPIAGGQYVQLQPPQFSVNRHRNSQVPLMYYSPTQPVFTYFPSPSANSSTQHLSTPAVQRPRSHQLPRSPSNGDRGRVSYERVRRPSTSAPAVSRPPDERTQLECRPSVGPRGEDALIRTGCRVYNEFSRSHQAPKVLERCKDHAELTMDLRSSLKQPTNGKPPTQRKSVSFYIAEQSRHNNEINARASRDKSLVQRWDR